MNKIKLIAEIGWNHLGDMDLAKEMIFSASSSGADYAKFQSWSVKNLKNGEWDSDGRREIYEKAELTKDKHELLIEYCNSAGIKFLSSVFSINDAKLLQSLGIKEVKIPGFESRNHDLIKYCNENFNRIFISSGTSSFEEIKHSVSLIKNAEFYIMHCVSSYPCEYEMANLPKMIEFFKIHDKIGYSDHIQGADSAIISIGLGATVVEKHFTIDNDLPGRDNKFAVLPEELQKIRLIINRREKMLIHHGLGYQDSEKDSRKFYSGRFDN